MPAISCDYSTDARACAAVTKALRLVGSRRVRRLLHVGGGSAIVRVAAGLVGIPAIHSKDGVIPQRAQDQAWQGSVARAIGCNRSHHLAVVGEGYSAGEWSAAARGDVGRNIQLLPEENCSARDGQNSGRRCLVDVLGEYWRCWAGVEIHVAAVNRGDGVR